MLHFTDLMRFVCISWLKLTTPFFGHTGIERGIRWTLPPCYLRPNALGAARVRVSSFVLNVEPLGAMPVLRDLVFRPLARPFPLSATVRLLQGHPVGKTGRYQNRCRWIE